jgi:hypothetical protein
LFVAVFLTPAGVVSSTTLHRALVGWLAVAGPVSVIWLLPVLGAAATLGQWAAAVSILLTFSATIGGIALAMERLGCPGVFAAGAAIVLGVVWLGWPVWLSGHLVNAGKTGVIRELVAVHPPLAINGILTNEPAWTERTLAYQLTDLNQDVAIQLPSGPGACDAVYGGGAIVLWTVAAIGEKRSRAAVLKSRTTRIE